jgi:hypothetical protein|tara:strand:- start:194 stop:1396 length:1203 start_codon:yes stop_codon:yes gene_type:complete
MGLAHSPRIVTDGLVLALDAGNVKSNSEISVKWNNLIADSTTVSSVGVITCTTIHNSDGNFFAQKYSSCEITGSTVWDKRPPTISEMGEVLSGNLTCKSHQTGTYNQVQYLFGGYPNAGDCCTLRFTGFGVGAVIGVGGYFASTRQCKLTGDLLNSPVTITSPSGGFADPIILTSDPADIKFTSVNAGGSDPWYVYWLGPYNQVPYNVRSNPGYVKGATYSSNDGGTLVFDQSNNDYVTTENTLTDADELFADTGRAWSASSWFNVDVISSADKAVISRGGLGQSGTNFLIWVENANLKVRLRGGTTTNISTSIAINTWYNVAITWDGTTAKGYLNGQFITTIPVATASLQTTHFGIGNAGSDMDREPFDGKISQVLAHNRALTAAEVLQNYNATKGRYA